MMKKEVSLRQIAYMYILISIAPILRQIPNSLASQAGRSGYLSPLWSILAIIPITAIIISLIKSFPGLNYYELMETILGKVLSKIVIFSYLIWLMITIPTKLNAYSLTLQFTLMPRTKTSFFLVTIVVLIFYGLSKGIRTIFRFAEFIVGPILILFLVLFIFAYSKIRPDYLIPVAYNNISDTIIASKNVLAVGGYIIIALFFADKYGLRVSKKNINKLWVGTILFVILAFLVTVFTYGVTGADLAASLPFPFYITVKSISLFNIFERFEVLITLICIISDFISISIYSVILVRCFVWLFNLKEKTFLYVPLTVIVYYLTYFISSSQFEYEFFYKSILVNLNLVFQYLIPLFIGLIGLLKKKAIRKQY